MSQPSSLLILTARYQDALQLAVEIHRHQSRKDTGIPYVAHLLNVSGLVLAHGGNEDEAIAALLHDSLEDHPDKITAADIELRFGTQVLQHVLDCTDTPEGYRGGPKPAWKDRKQQHIQKIAKVAQRSHRILIADKLDNVRSTLTDYKCLGEKVWLRFRAPRHEQLWYQQSLLQAFRTAGIQTPLLRTYEEAVQELLALCAAKQGVA